MVNSLKNFKIAAVLAAFFVVAMFAGCSNEPEIKKLSGRTMGTSWSVVIANPIAIFEQEEIQNEIETVLLEVNRQMSTYDPASEISRFNQSEDLNTWYAVSELFAATTARALWFSEISKGSFDPTVGPLVNLWGFGPDTSAEVLPSGEAIALAMSTVGFSAIAVRGLDTEDGSAILKTAQRYLDLSAIAKGVGVDQVYALLDNLGYSNFLVEIGGEVRVKGDKDGLGWRIAVEKPVKDDRTVEGLLSLKDLALATSGDYRNYLEIEGVTYSHTIEPSTGRPVTHQLASVTVADSACAIADGWATTLLVLGPTKGYQLAIAQDLPAMFIERSDDDFVIKKTPRFEQLFAGDI
ncbi:MAG: FAD:protein FMN transferase ApbE [Gammaproteobacteria bacterium]|nr:FAD:protein FMN transferase ApbE [Gammaproteobacteria bacterium]HAN80081.1 FAD:protein FMN transferase ApbE [Gammaproteobacteria bacterium]